jgi:hypothetical protein
MKRRTDLSEHANSLCVLCSTLKLRSAVTLGELKSSRHYCYELCGALGPLSTSAPPNFESPSFGSKLRGDGTAKLGGGMNVGQGRAVAFRDAQKINYYYYNRVAIIICILLCII